MLTITCTRIIPRCLLALSLNLLFLSCLMTAPVYGATEDRSNVALFTSVGSQNQGETYAFGWGIGDNIHRMPDVHETQTAHTKNKRSGCSSACLMRQTARVAVSEIPPVEIKESDSGLSSIQILALAVALVGAPAFIIMRARNKNKGIKGSNRNRDFKVPGMDSPEEPTQRALSSTEARPQKWILTGVTGLYSGKKILISKELRIGRNTATSNVCYPNGVGVSKAHCIIVLRNDRPYIQDLASTYGTHVNGERLTPQMLIPLRDGDEIYLGNEGESFLVGTLP